MTDDGVLHNTRRTFGKVMELLLHNTAITDGAIRLYAHMHWRYGQSKRNWEGQRSMAKYLGVTEKTISARIQELEQHDWVVVVLRGYNPKTGAFQTPYYHVFEDQADCIAFREDFQPQTNEALREKGHGRVRKSRQGAGNKQASPPRRQNLSSNGRQNLSSNGRQNLSSNGRQNLSSNYLDSVDLDSIEPDTKKSIVREEQRTVSVVNDPKNEIDLEEWFPRDPDGLADKPTGIVGVRPRDPIFDLIESLWLFGSGGRTAKVKKLMSGGFVKSGNAKTDKRDTAWIENNIDPPMDEREIAAFGEWYRDNNPEINLPEKPESISKWVHRFRISDEYRDYYPVEAKQESQNAQNVETPEARLAKVRRAADLTKKTRRKYDKL
jgi:hypothetical protein